MKTKICSKCKRELLADSKYFYKDANKTCGFDSRCKECKGGNFEVRIIPKEGFKICTECKVEKESTKEHWHALKGGKDGLRSKCKECMKEYVKQTKEYRASWSKEHRTKNREKILEANKRYYEENKESILRKSAEYKKLNKRKIVLYHHNNYKKNKEKIQSRNKEYYLKNKDSFIKNTLKRRATMKSLEVGFTVEQWDFCKNQFDHKCAYCGCESKLEMEHFIPLTRNGEFTINNIIPACRGCNSSKNNKDFFEWYPTHESYSKARECKILKYLKYKSNIQQLSIL